jgi:hypothetical protein
MIFTGSSAIPIDAAINEDPIAAQPILRIIFHLTFHKDGDKPGDVK